MNAELAKVQKRLYLLGVRDVKIFLNPHASQMSQVEISNHIAFLLNTHLDGYSVPLGCFGD